MKNKRDKIEYLLFWLAIFAVTFFLFIGQLNAQPTKKELYNELIKQNVINPVAAYHCLLYTSDAADD